MNNVMDHELRNLRTISVILHAKDNVIMNIVVQLLLGRISSIMINDMRSNFVLHPLHLHEIRLMELHALHLLVVTT
jgi:hypothetical protein